MRNKATRCSNFKIIVKNKGKKCFNCMNRDVRIIYRDNDIKDSICVKFLDKIGMRLLVAEGGEDR